MPYPTEGHSAGVSSATEEQHRMCNREKLYTGILAILAVILLAVSQVLWFLPALSYAETAGDVLVVRVQYFGEIGDKIREKARFSRSDLEAMGADTYYYSNITRVGTVMSMAARGPEVMTIIEQAGIDPGSIMNITFRTTDGYTRNFTVDRHLLATKYFYPYLASGYERNEDGNALTPLEGALDDAVTVPAILALEFGESKEPGIFAEDLAMGTKKTYRFCMGQSPLEEGRMTDPNDDGGDISSMESCHSIYGIDVTLAGSPIQGMALDLDDTTIKVGSMKKIAVEFYVDEAFEGAFTAEDLIWTSSDESIATVNGSGEVTIHGSGQVTITATAPDGTSASITINGEGEEDEGGGPEEEASEDEPDDTRPDRDKKPSGNNKHSGKQVRRQAEDQKRKQTENKSETKQKKAIPLVKAREIVIGDMIAEEVSPQEVMREEMADDANALDEARTYSEGAAAGTAAGAGALCGAGAITRIIRYRRDFK